MNDEIVFLHIRKYIKDIDYKLVETEYLKLDKLAELLLNPDNNFDKIKNIWKIEA